jgi:hypothetical protein
VTAAAPRLTFVAKAALAVFLVAELVMIGAGVFLLVQRETGTRVKATVTGCVQTGAGRTETTDCTGTWVVGGALVGGDGRIVVGEVAGATKSDVGKTIDVTLRGDTAYTRSLKLPLLLIGLGLVVPVLAGVAVVNARRRRRRATRD